MKNLLKNKKALIIIGLVLVVGAGAFFFLFTGKASHPDPKVQEVIDLIYRTQEWLAHMKRTAAQDGKTVEQQIIDNAIYTVQNR